MLYDVSIRLFDLLGIRCNDELEKTLLILVVVDESFISMMECSLNFDYIVCRFTNVDVFVLRILYRESAPNPFIIIIPSSFDFVEVAPIFPNGNSDNIIVKINSIKMKEVYQVLS